MCADIQNSDVDDYLQFKSGSIKSNKVANGAVFYFKEATDMVFGSSDLPPSKSGEPDIGKLNFDSCLFSYNYVSEEIGATSCVHIDKTA